MSRSNYDKPFYVDVGTSIVAIRCASNHDVVLRYDHIRLPQTIQLAEAACDRMNKEVEIRRPPRNCDSTVGSVCRECAIKAGYTPKNKVVGVWLDECGICHKRKPCTNLHHDWRKAKEGGAQ